MNIPKDNIIDIASNELTSHHLPSLSVREAITLYMAKPCYKFITIHILLTIKFFKNTY